jgi:single-strand DNA-binding protein
VCEFASATSESWKGKDGNKQERTEWHNIKAFKKLAEICGKYLAKGKQVYIEGKIQTRTWDKDGQKHYRTEIVANEVQFLGGGKGGGGAPGGAADQFSPAADDDIPFVTCDSSADDPRRRWSRWP